VSVLEQRLEALGRELDWPSEPELAPAVLARLNRRPFPWRPVALGFAVLAVAVGAAFAVPQARTTILKWFHLRGVSVERVDTLPDAVERSQAEGLGRPFSRAEAERRLGFRIALPPLAGDTPKRVYVLDDALGTVILQVDGRSVLLSEFQAVGFDLLKKAVSGRTDVEPVRVNGKRGLWVEGGPHTLTYFNRLGEFQERTVLVRGNVLLWVRGNLTLRLEGKLSKAKALRIARRID
jgi:hypothetical protein